jgi:hypothetical protein
VIYEFHEPIEVETPIGKGRALFVERTPHDYWWTVALNDSAALVTFPQNKIRITRSYTQGRGISDEEMRKIVKRVD